MRAVNYCLAAALFLATAARAEEVGSFSNDWTGNRIIVDAIPDPKIQGITCHVTHFDRSIYDLVFCLLCCQLLVVLQPCFLIFEDEFLQECQIFWLFLVALFRWFAYKIA